MLNLIQKEIRAGLFKILPIACILIVSACTARVIAPEATSPSSEMKKILVLPFENISSLYGEDVSIRDALSGKMFTTGKVAQGAEDILTEHLVSLIKRRSDLEMIPTDQAQGIRSDLLSKNKIEIPELDLIVETGRHLGADAVLVGHLYRFKERAGTGYSVDSPASVSFNLVVVRVADGQIAWNGRFDETQESLFENLLSIGKFLKRRGRWVTAEKLAVSGLESVLEKFPGL